MLLYTLGMLLFWLAGVFAVSSCRDVLDALAEQRDSLRSATRCRMPAGQTNVINMTPQRVRISPRQGAIATDRISQATR